MTDTASRHHPARETAVAIVTDGVFHLLVEEQRRLARSKTADVRPQRNPARSGGRRSA